MSALGWVYVCGRNLVPAPATGIIAFISFVKVVHFYMRSVIICLARRSFSERQTVPLLVILLF